MSKSVLHPFFKPLCSVGENVTEINMDTISELLNYGFENSSRNGPVKYLPRAEMILQNPRERYLNLPGRDFNIFQVMAETFWVMAGKDEIKPFLEFFLPRAADYSDDGKTWRGAYGPRIFGGAQVQGVVDAFCKDGPDTRRAVISIYDPSKDSPEAICDVYGLEKTKDLPCNDFIQFWACPNNFLHMEVFQRSGDILWGTGSINLYEFSFFHETVLQYLHAEGLHDMKLGSYRHLTTNLHIYYTHPSVAKQIPVIQKFLNSQSEEIIDHVNSLGIVTGEIDLPVDFVDGGFFFDALYDFFCGQISGHVAPDSTPHSVFERFSVPTTSSNTLYVTAMLVAAFIRAKVTGERVNFDEKFVRQHHEPLYHSIVTSKFNRLDFV